MQNNRRGFTLIELLTAVVIIGILVAVALPRFGASKDRAKLASIKADVRNAETSQETYFSNYNTYGTYAQLQAASNFSLSSGNTMVITAATNGYTVGATNSSISSGVTSCKVQVGSGAAASVDAIISCP